MVDYCKHCYLQFNLHDEEVESIEPCAPSDDQGFYDDDPNEERP